MPDLYLLSAPEHLRIQVALLLLLLWVHACQGFVSLAAAVALMLDLMPGAHAARMCVWRAYTFVNLLRFNILHLHVSVLVSKSC